MAMGVTILKRYEVLSKRLANKFSKIWVGAELLLFVLVGAAVDFKYVGVAGKSDLILIIIAMIFRMVGVNVCLINTPLDKKERLFTSIVYIPKATVQAAFGSIPLSLGLASGNIILSVAVMAILITAPLGAKGIDFTYKRLLNHSSTIKDNNEL